MRAKSQETDNFPLVLSHQPIRFETAHSWNKGVGNKNPNSDGNGGKNYKNEPRDGKPGSGPPPVTPWQPHK
ncbi:hypothetical protein AB1K84_18860 [Mesobacillus foraminis]|uniref:hypothetical protein n=1 Tax=Mesobacillus foraminis TaxID=279826 RepID=UPI00399FF0D6